MRPIIADLLIMPPITFRFDFNGLMGLTQHPSVYIAIWIFFSNLTITFNKWLIDNAGFRYPVILTWCHMTFATLATQVLARTTTLFDGRHKIKITPWIYAKSIVPIGLLYSGSMVCSTLVYLYLSVPFIQILKALVPSITLFLGLIWGTEKVTLASISSVTFITLGVIVASWGTIHFSWPGFIYQLLCNVFESLRILMIQSLISSTGLDMDPLVSLYYYAPVCAVSNLILSIASGWSSFEWTHVTEVGVWMLLLNAIVAFLLNVSSVLLIGKTSAVVMTLTDVFKNIILVITSVVIWGTPISTLQKVGYFFTLVGLAMYQSQGKKASETFTACVQWIMDLRRRFRKPRLVFAAVLLSILVATAILEARHVYVSKPSTIQTVEGIDRLSNGWLTWLQVKDGKWWVGNI
ncbi:hypothetical protein M426DRAFT_229325 [Hypoxylon sp. CI-4A]|nr:hypothetical protein M426DRAFT_229325 [Hypoxylon sp. CI-4A]